jgi:hypothetical protein
MNELLTSILEEGFEVSFVKQTDGSMAANVKLPGTGYLVAHAAADFDPEAALVAAFTQTPDYEEAERMEQDDIPF